VIRNPNVPKFLITSRGSPLAYAYLVWWTFVNAFMSYIVLTDRRTDKQTDRQTDRWTDRTKERTTDKAATIA